MRQKKTRYCFLFLFLLLYAGNAYTADKLIFSGIIRDAVTHETLPSATVLLESEETRRYSAIAGDDGTFRITDVFPGIYKLTVSFIGYGRQQRTVELKKSTYMTIGLRSDNQLKEVVITATESKGLVSSSKIDRPAMQHLQPTSFADLLELLPGGMSRDPDMGSANTITLRETGVIKADGTKGDAGSDYSITSLGTQFIVDGIPINTDANLQASPVSDNSAESSRNIVNRGVDMRSISTDDIESVEVVRGIPSAEYGNLTSGIVNIKKVRKLTPLNARFKADGYSKLFSAGKGFALPGAEDGVVNVDVGYLDSKPDPRNNLVNYKRMNTSLRFTWNYNHDNWTMRYAPGIDYTGSFDNAKEDPELNYGNTDTYKSTYNRVALTNNFLWTFPKVKAVKGIELNTSANAQFDRLTRRKLVAPQRYMIVPSTTGEGEHDATLLFKEYVADYLSDGKPFNAFIKLKGDFSFTNGPVKNNAKVGGEWSYTKNFGRGQVYDLTRPLAAGGWSSRPRAYKDIPALQNVGVFIEDVMTAKIGRHKLELMGGIRAMALVGLDKRYVLNNKFYLDPRINGLWNFPAIDLGKTHNLEIALGGGIGWTTKMPTLDYLFPDAYYKDIVQLGYYDVLNPEQNSRFNIRSYIEDRTNYELRPARNKKWELRADFTYGGNRLSVSYFRESMNTGFRYVANYTSYAYKEYDASKITGSALQGPPSLDDLPYTDKKILGGYNKATNGSRLLKEGVEFQFRSQRIKPLRTVVNLSGAWFRSTYTNSIRMPRTVSEMVDGQSISDSYIGIYNWDDGNVYQQFNTNLMFDTQIPEWGLIFSTSLQCMWFTSKQAFYRDGVPESYLWAEDGQEHPYTEASKEDLYLQHLIIPISSGTFDKYTVPMAFYVNLKVTKKIGKYLNLAFFANKLLDYTPDFKSRGLTVRRNVEPYFGMELNFSL